MIKKWHIKAVVQKAISALPLKHEINYLFQKHVTKGLVLTDDLFFDRLGHAVDHLTAYQSHANNRPLDKTFELGTGWYPIVPIALFLGGASEIHTADIARLCSKTQILSTLNMFVKQIDLGNLAPILLKNTHRIALMRQLAKAGEGQSFEDLANHLNLKYRVNEPIASNETIGYFDLVTSNNTFEHVYPNDLRAILQDLASITRKDGIMSHFIDLSDHYAHFDSQITVYNFLKYSDSQWLWIDNSIQPMNRFRISDYRQIYQELQIPISAEVNRPGDLEALLSVKLDPKFQAYSNTDLAVSHSLVISVMN
jgi:hypothetical protein